MGPRLVGRGKIVGLVGCLSIQYASMGPRLVGRGKKIKIVEAPTEAPCFNGAASCGTRKDARPGGSIRRRVGASMGPRLVGRGKKALCSQAL